MERKRSLHSPSANQRLPRARAKPYHPQKRARSTTSNGVELEALLALAAGCDRALLDVDPVEVVVVRGRVAGAADDA